MLQLKSSSYPFHFCYLRTNDLTRSYWWLFTYKDTFDSLCLTSSPVRGFFSLLFSPTSHFLPSRYPPLSLSHSLRICTDHPHFPPIHNPPQPECVVSLSPCWLSGTSTNFPPSPERASCQCTEYSHSLSRRIVPLPPLSRLFF